jgi:DNA/RNA-binding domain of Phe-tRNA-synthetase-like protein
MSSHDPGAASLTVTVAPHELLDVALVRSELPRPLGRMKTPSELLALLAAGVDVPMQSDDAVRQAVRDLLRRAGFKPTGRSKPASEYLANAVAGGTLGPESAINLAVDAGNIVSLHSGLPISVVDLQRGRAPWHIAVAEAGASYVFNAAGQVIDVAKLLCLHDADGPCANAVKDAQRTKTTDETRETLTVIWGTRALPGRAEEAATWYRLLLQSAGIATEPVAATPTATPSPHS